MLQQIKQDIIASMKAKNTVKTSILRLIVSECDLINARTGKVTDEDVTNVIKKMIKSIEESLEAIRGKWTDRYDLIQEQAILENYLPRKLCVEEIEEKLDKEMIKNSKNDGMAIGLAMKSLKGCFIDGSDVKLVVEKIRNGS
jgi:uncharacterized protein YqeY